MREAHREAARILYEDRNQDSDDSRELYVDLHGMQNLEKSPTILTNSFQVCILMNRCRTSRAYFSSTARPPAQYMPSREPGTTPRTARTRLVKPFEHSSTSGGMLSASFLSLVTATTSVVYSASTPVAMTRVLQIGQRSLSQKRTRSIPRSAS